MGFINSASTLYANAALTETGRKYVFDAANNPRRVTLPNGQTVDKLAITSFSLGDPDVNYNIPSNLLPQSGSILDTAGSYGTGINGAENRMLMNIISPGDSDIPSGVISNVNYQQTNANIVFDMSKSLSTLPTVIHQQLMTFVNGSLVSDGTYLVTPTNYGSNALTNNELVITLKEPTLTQSGYRLRIFYPTTGQNYNKMTFQFEKAATQQATVATSVVQTVTAVPVNSAAASIINVTPPSA